GPCFNICTFAMFDPYGFRKRLARLRIRRMADDKLSPRRGRKPPLGDKRQFLTTMDPEVIRAIKQAALDADRTASDLVEEADKQRLERHKHKKWSEFPQGRRSDVIEQGSGSGRRLKDRRM